MVWFSWSHWNPPVSPMSGYGQSFPVVTDLTGSTEETEALKRESSGEVVYIPVYVGWM